MITANEFINLSKGDEIQFKLNDVWINTKCLNNAFYNSDSDEPGYEVETKAGILSMYNDIIIKEKNEPRQFTIQMTFNEDDIKSLEKKFGSINNEKDITDSIFECISTYLEL